MGQVLSEPITQKSSESGSGDHLFYGYSAMQGWRLTMEDSHTAALNLGGNKDLSFFGVFDGHGGTKVAEYAGRNLSAKLQSTAEFKKGDYSNALIKSFLGLDDDIRSELKDHNSGATAVTCLVTADRLICANAGDSRCVIGQQGKAIPLSFDHKPNTPAEFERIRSAGGFVEFNRVNGNLALSRAFGDLTYKANDKLPPEKQVVTVFPDIIDHKLDETVDFMVLACDGIWDCMSNQEVVDFVQQQICQGKELATVCEELLDFCLAPDSYLGAVGCDNMSVIIVGFLNGGRTREQWLEQCRRTVNPNPVVSTHIRSAGSGGGVDAADDDVASQMVRLAAATSITTTAATVREDVNGGSGKLQLTSTTATTTTTTTTASATIIKDSKLQK